MHLTSNLNMNPARLADESFEDYKARRRAQKYRVRLLTRGPRQLPFKPKTNLDGTPALPNVGTWWLGQYTNPGKNQHRKAVKAAGGIRQYKKQVRVLRQAMFANDVASSVRDIDPVAWNNLQAA
jgi:hypothetical protein